MQWPWMGEYAKGGNGVRLDIRDDATDITMCSFLEPTVRTVARAYCMHSHSKHQQQYRQRASLLLFGTYSGVTSSDVGARESRPISQVAHRSLSLLHLRLFLERAETRAECPGYIRRPQPTSCALTVDAAATRSRLRRSTVQPVMLRAARFRTLTAVSVSAAAMKLASTSAPSANSDDPSFSLPSIGAGPLPSVRSAL